MDERYLNRLRRETGRLIVQGQGMLDELTARGKVPAKQWWNVPAKAGVAEAIMRDEGARAKREAGKTGASNNRFDAMRHARASKRLTEETGPIFAEVAGVLHEVDNVANNIGQHTAKAATFGLWPKTQPTGFRQTLAESAMDLRNNAKGRDAALNHREIDPAELQASPLRRPLRQPQLNRASLPR